MKSLLTVRDVQTSIDCCADGSWEGVLLVGSIFVQRVHSSSFQGVAVKLHQMIVSIERGEDFYLP